MLGPSQGLVPLLAGANDVVVPAIAGRERALLSPVENPMARRSG